jgi:arylsulfatase A-like enzyme
MLEMTGLDGDDKHNADMDGVSLVPLLTNPNAALKRNTLYWHYPHYYPTTTPVSSIRMGDWKLLEYFEDNRVELYNLARDIGERNNLASQMPEKAEQLRRRLHAWREDVNAQIPAPNPKRSSGPGR